MLYYPNISGASPFVTSPAASTPPNQVTIRVPATTANLGPGFDCLGFALDIVDTVTMARSPRGDDLSRLAGEDRQQAELVLLAARRLLTEANSDIGGLTVTCRRQIPLGRGLGSSAAAIVAGVLGANELAGRPLDQEALGRLAAAIEGHPDNSSPCLFGGFQVCAMAGAQLWHIGLPIPPELTAALFIPDFPMPTHETRKLLPETLSRADVVFQTSRAALMVGALATGRFDCFDEATQDRLHQPARGTVFAGMWDLFAAAKGAGALCAYLSGGGPTVLALVDGPADAVVAAMEQKARGSGIGGHGAIAHPANAGAHVVACA
ncbi:MAG: homoserine kinase [Dehalococcoidia bacterium]|nr:homoserine kinase [Dehalococcoidia bacterium]